MKFDKWGYDEYDSFLVSADNPKECKEIVEKAHPKEEYPDVQWDAGFKITTIGVTNRKKEILLSSYNAG